MQAGRCGVVVKTHEAPCALCRGRGYLETNEICRLCDGAAFCIGNSGTGDHGHPSPTGLEQTNAIAGAFVVDARLTDENVMSLPHSN